MAHLKCNLLLFFFSNVRAHCVTVAQLVEVRLEIKLPQDNGLLVLDSLLKQRQCVVSLCGTLNLALLITTGSLSRKTGICPNIHWDKKSKSDATVY